MKKYLLPIALVIALNVIGVLYYFKSVDHKQPAGASQQAQKYYCPMHPNYVSDKPGTCPICHMTLVAMEKKGDADSECVMHECPMLKMGQDCPMLLLPKGQGEAQCPYCSKHLQGNEATAPMPATSLQVSESSGNKIGMRIERAQKRKLQKEITLQARVAYDPELYQAQLDFLQKIKRYQRPSNVIDPYSGESAERAKIELTKAGIPAEMMEEMKLWKKPDARLLGSDPSGQLWVYAYFYEEDSVFAKPGAILEIAVPGAETIRTPILYVDSVIQSASRTLRARALVENPNKALRPDMYLQAKLISELGEKLSVPAEALLHAGDKPYVFVKKEGNLYEPRTIHIGQKAGDYYEVLSGLTEGESVIVSGNFLLDSESRIQAALSGASDAPAGEHRHD
jgi:Cu(I)/Ag(I) efflux system membrane fusion protein